MRLVGLEATRDQASVQDHLVAGGDLDQVAPDQLRRDDAGTPSRMTVAVGRVSRLMLVQGRLARTSWTTLTTMLVDTTPTEISASRGRPTTTRATPSRKRMLLMKVKTFSRTISQ